MGRQFTTEASVDESDIRNIIDQHAYGLPDMAALEPLLEKIGNAKIVMLGEASHGTHEYFTWRSYITRKLIEEKGFNFIAVEGDWPDCYRVNRYVKGYEDADKRPAEILHAFNRWPTWMWANHEMVVFTKWLRNHNEGLTPTGKVGFYGLDMYSLWESMDSIMHYLQKNDPSALHLAEQAFNCFEPYSKHEGIGYAKASAIVPDLCQAEVVGLLREIQEKRASYNSDHENLFNLEQNARVVANAEEYYRTMVMGGPHSWNLRDRHMADTMDRLLEFHGPDAKAIVWAHNSHIGDARATDMVDEGMFNLGEIARIRHHDEGVQLVGFGSYRGTVVAADRWGAPMEIIDMPPAKQNSWEDHLHQCGAENKLLLLDELIENQTMLETHFEQRAVGVVYDPRREAYGNYVPSIIPLRYNAFVYIDETRALHPLHLEGDTRQMPETYPSGV